MQTLLLLAALGLAQEPPLQIPPPTPAAPTTAPEPAAKPAPETRTPAPAPTSAAVPAAPAPAPSIQPAGSPLSFFSDSFGYAWDRIIPLSINLDGLKVNSIFFNKRAVKSGVLSFLNDAEFGTRARVEVTNTSAKPKIPGFVVAVLDKEGRLIGAASGGTKVGTIKPGETETFDLNFSQVKERLALGDKFLLAIELRN